MRWQVKHTLTKKDPQARLDQLQELLFLNRDLKTDSQRQFFIAPPQPTPALLLDKLPDLDVEQLEKAVLLIKQALEEQRPIIIYGDYDVDGICATAILWQTLYDLGGKVLPFIPHRQKHGYGLNKAGLAAALELFDTDSPLIITVDNGITSQKTAQEIKDSPVDLIITDHHQPLDELPPALGIVHSTHTSGSAVSWLLASKLSGQTDHLDLVALGTVCDVLPLTGPNRMLVKAGLEALHQTENLGLKTLCRVAGLQPADIETYHLGFILGPRINAAGRLDHGLDALRLLTTTSPSRARKLAQKLDTLNRKRQDLTARHTRQTIAQFRDLPQLPPILLASSTDYPEGIIGLIAAKLSQRFHRPSLVVALDKDQAKGSARSIPGVDVTQLISSAEHLLSSFGGHSQAAGLSTSIDQLPSLKEALLQAAQDIDEKLFEKALRIEAHLSPADLTFDTLKLTEKLSPFGLGNPRPVFASQLPVAGSRLVGSNKKHLKLSLKRPYQDLDAIGFYQAPKRSLLQTTSKPHLAFVLQANTFQGRTNLQLNLKDIKAKA